MQKIPKEPADVVVQIAARIRSERERIGMTLEAFADVGGFSKTSQHRYEAGGSCPDASYLKALHDRLDIDVLFIVTGQKQMKKSALASNEAELLDRYRNLPSALQSYIDKSALLAWLAFQDRKGYHLNEAKL